MMQREHFFFSFLPYSLDCIIGQNLIEEDLDVEAEDDSDWDEED